MCREPFPTLTGWQPTLFLGAPSGLRCEVNKDSRSRHLWAAHHVTDVNTGTSPVPTPSMDGVSVFVSIKWR